MPQPRNPDDDSARVVEGERSSEPEVHDDAALADIGELVRQIAGTEIGCVSLLDPERGWITRSVGSPALPPDAPLALSFAAQTVLSAEPLLIADASVDPRFRSHPLVQGPPHLRGYAGFPLFSHQGLALGTLAAFSSHSHQLSLPQIESLQRLASLTLQRIGHSPPATPPEAPRSAPDPGGRDGRVGREALRSLACLISRDQMLQHLDQLYATQPSSPFSLLRCWFRDYERVTFTLGGLMAEHYINEAARRIVAALPPAAAVARFADAELMVLLPLALDDEALKALAERILAFANHVYRIRHESLAMTVSIGIASSHNNYDCAEAILADTNLALRMARRSAASAFRFINAESRISAKETYRFESEFREALAAKLLEPHLQSIVDLRSGELIGFEALARWPHQDGFIMPAQFIPLAGECGLTGELDLLIIEKSLAALSLLAQPIPHRPMRLSLNLSGILMEDAELRERLLSLLDDNPWPPGWKVQMELVEDMFQDTSESFNLFLDALVQRGVDITIDDFGTGYSSLARLISLPIQGVKVDRAFIARLNDPQDSPRTLLRTMLTMLNDLGLEITAEGVESEQQRDWLLTHGAGKAQGFLFSRPVPIREAILMLQSLEYRPSAIPVDRNRIRAARRRRLRSLVRLPLLDLWGERSGNSL